MEWDIGYLEIAEGWLDGLSKEKLKSVAKEIRLLEHCGNTLKLPHSRSLGGGLFELRERRFGIRLYYYFHHNKAIIVLCGGDKSSQENDIKKARELLNRISR